MKKLWIRVILNQNFILLQNVYRKIIMKIKIKYNFIKKNLYKLDNKIMKDKILTLPKICQLENMLIAK